MGSKSTRRNGASKRNASTKAGRRSVRDLSARKSSDVKGGREPSAPSVSEIVVTKPTDVSTAKLF